MAGGDMPYEEAPVKTGQQVNILFTGGAFG